jgi:N-acetylglucosamine kinase-like BadF-type ATPase
VGLVSNEQVGPGDRGGSARVGGSGWVVLVGDSGPSSSVGKVCVTQVVRARCADRMTNVSA